MKIGIIGNGFVGNATLQLECSDIEILVYDINPSLCKPKGTKLDDLISCEIIFIVDKGVPNEWAAAAAWPPNDTNSCSFEITSWILSKASFLTLDSFPKVRAKKLRKISAIIKAIGTE